MATDNDIHRHLGRARDAVTLDEYESPDEYADQDDTRVVKVLQFPYHVLAPSPMIAGEEIIQERVARQGDTVFTDELGLLKLEQGEREGYFYTTDELDRLKSGRAVAGVLPEGVPVEAEGEVDFKSFGSHEMVEYLEDNKPKVDETVALVGTDAAAARRLLEAENIVTGNDPRAGVEKALTRIIAENS